LRQFESGWEREDERSAEDRIRHAPQETVEEDASHAAVLKARPVKNPGAYEEMLRLAKKRFSKTLAYLAR
jgi:hypothetical protein